MSLNRVWILAIACSLVMNSNGQHKYTDSLTQIIKTTKSDSIKIDALYSLSYEYQSYKPDSALLTAQQLLDFSTEKNNVYGQSLALDGLAGAFLRMGDNTKALEYYLKRLKIEETRNSIYNIAILYMNMANVYNRNKDTAESVLYILKADSIIEKNNYSELKSYVYLNTGNIFEKANRLSEALSFTNKCYDLALANKDSLMIGSSLNNLGNIYLKLNDYANAIKNYRHSKEFITAENDNQTLTEGYIGLAHAYLFQKKQDSALYYAKLAFTLAHNNDLLNNALSASKFLSDIYKDQKKYDSAYFYQSTMIALDDSIQSSEKIKQLESMSIQEQLRQQQIAILKQKEKLENRQKLQFLAIGFTIPIFFFFSIFISKRKVHRKLIQFFGVLSLLLFFEYLTLLLHPFVSDLANHSPFIEIFVFVCIGALIVPAHHRLEHWFTKHLAKNIELKKIKPISEETEVTQIKNEPEKNITNLKQLKIEKPASTVEIKKQKPTQASPKNKKKSTQHFKKK